MIQTLKRGQRPKTENVECPNSSEHGTTVKRWLRGAYESIAAGGAGTQVADVFEIDCPTCGKFECREEC
jgi:hypothetical protein